MVQFCYTVSMWRGTCHAAFAGWAGENPTQALAVFLRRRMQQPVSQHMPYSCRLRRRAGHATLVHLAGGVACANSVCWLVGKGPPCTATDMVLGCMQRSDLQL